MNLTECLKYDPNFFSYLPASISNAWENGFPYHCYQLKDGDNVMGFALFDLTGARHIACMSYIYVHPHYRGKHICEDMLNEIYAQLFNKGFDKIYASLYGDERETQNERYFLESQNFNPILTRSYLTYLMEDISRSEVYNTLSENSVLRSSVVLLNRSENKTELLHKLAKMGITEQEGIDIGVVLSGDNIIGAMTFIVNHNNEIMVLETIVPEDKSKGRLMIIMLVAIIKASLANNPDIDYVRALCQDNLEVQSCEKCFGESFDTRYREEWVLNIASDASPS